MEYILYDTTLSKILNSVTAEEIAVPPEIRS